MSPFVFPLSAIARAHDPTVISSVALRKGPRRFCLHRTAVYWCLRVETHPCGNVVNAVIMLCLRLAAMARSIEQRGHHVTCALIGTSHKPSALNNAWVRTDRYKLRYPKVGVEPATRSAVATWNHVISKDDRMGGPTVDVCSQGNWMLWTFNHMMTETFSWNTGKKSRFYLGGRGVALPPLLYQATISSLFELWALLFPRCPPSLERTIQLPSTV